MYLNLEYGILLLENSSVQNIEVVFFLQKKAIWFVAGLTNCETHKKFFKGFRVLTLLCFLYSWNVTIFQIKVLSYQEQAGAKLFNKFLKNIKDLQNYETTTVLWIVLLCGEVSAPEILIVFKLDTVRYSSP